MKSILIPLAAATFCACATAYHLVDDTGGYYQAKVPASISGNEDTYKVGFKGNSHTDFEDISKWEKSSSINSFPLKATSR
jgi:hypothetical protein